MLGCCFTLTVLRRDQNELLNAFVCIRKSDIHTKEREWTKTKLFVFGRKSLVEWIADSEALKGRYHSIGLLHALHLQFIRDCSRFFRFYSSLRSSLNSHAYTTQFVSCVSFKRTNRRWFMLNLHACHVHLETNRYFCFTYITHTHRETKSEVERITVHTETHSFVARLAYRKCRTHTHILGCYSTRNLPSLCVYFQATFFYSLKSKVTTKK